MFEEMQRELFEEIQRMMDTLPKDLVKETRTPTGIKRQYGPFIYGYSITIGPDGKPVFRQFGNVSPAALPRGLEVKVEREPLVDVFEEEKSVKVVAEIPGVKKEDIDLTVDGNRLIIRVDTPERKYYKEVELPAEVSTTNVKAGYNNGVLEVSFPKKEPAKPRGEKIKVE